MFVQNENVTLEDLGDGVSRKILAHSDNMMSVECILKKMLLARCIIIRMSN